MRTYFFLLLFNFLILALGLFNSSGFVDSSQDVQKKEAQHFEPKFKISKKTTHKIPKGQKFTFGYLEVLEDRSQPEGQTIQLPIYIFKSRNPNPKPDPIIYTVGGPGSSTMPSAPYMNYYQYLDERDFILIEQRGTAFARPHLDCPEWSQALHDIAFLDDSEESDSLLQEAVKSCKERLIAHKINLNCYNTNAIAADIADLVNVLKIDAYNLLTISYSTKIAQVLLRDYPASIRSVVMDSALPLEVNYEEESIANLLENLDLVLNDCAANEACNSNFPQLKERFKAFLVEKTKEPLQLSVPNPENGEMESFRLRGKDLINVYTSVLNEDYVDVPMQINKLLDGKYDYLEQMLVGLFDEGENRSGMGMRLSVWCAEEYPFIDQEVVKLETQRHSEIKGLSPAFFSDSICDIWGVKKASDEENNPVHSNIPVLFINGSYDYETPPKWAENMMRNFKNSYQLVFPGWTHTPTTNWSNQCAMTAANMFFNDPNTLPMPTCLEEIKRQF